MDNDKIVSALNDLLTKNYDAEKGYKEAAEKIEHTSLKDYFLKQSQNRYDFGHEIKALIAKYGGEPDKGTSVTGDLHRMWIAIRDAFSRGDQDIYEECIRGEEAFSEEYGETLRNEILPEDVKEVVRKQKNSVDQALATLRTMEGFSAK
ncbi:PA2169 family four-helix-bundle protein [Chryseobacterium salipaludis]|uniref:ferritin-like domain-containing protein n=1 Tax=Chryseobacterium TaxID=59732 RepID=UPI001FF68FA6|nr:MULTISPECIES: PA2169 family four-helix-bundle protein [Chryseobacterium]MCJ8498217.1 PA2169 family four-helix-bundle protein [Chryseobacterium salipaludis]MCX3297535.1 PA2169 family four-helix-bundle protein [Planobacterium sp. JC490]